MRFHRWHTTLAVLGTLYVQSYSLAQEPELNAFVESLISQVAEKPYPQTDQPAPSSPSDPPASPSGNKVTTSGHKIIIQLPNGETREIQLTPPPAQQAKWSEVMARLHQSEEAVTPPKFIIGVALAEVPDSLRSHVDLPEGQGVMVGSVTPEGPAARAGIEQFDILLKAGDRELKTPIDLKEVVDGQEIQPVTLTLLRHGEQKTLEVTPIKREDLKLPEDNVRGLNSLPVMGNVFVTPSENLIGTINSNIGMLGTVQPLPAQQQADLTHAIQKLSEQVEKLQEKVEHLERSLDSSGKPTTDSESGEGGCRQIPKRELLTSLITLS